MAFTGGSVCSAIHCTNNRKKTPQLSFFRFPKDPERSRKWLVNSRREDLIKKEPVYLYNNIRFCSLHFEQNLFMNADNNKLVWNAVPTLFDIPNKPPQLTMKRKLPQRFDSQSKAVKQSYDTEAAGSTLHVSVPDSCELSTQTCFDDEVVRLSAAVRVLQKRVKCQNVQIARLRPKLLRDKESAYRQRQKLYQKEQVNKDKRMLKTIGSPYLKKVPLTCC
ncbi:THAP domain-containing protein 2-like [Schistocerca serialis cubense]|uniref:THAP domain-containing protein 2-like n=2 Tax=Schistocerca serialis cubense TaxID=2023355 RepID=UPI00214EAE40|nr:THAP domain-containing protein 2-like [Schistocerca serialis cubense]